MDAEHTPPPATPGGGHVASPPPKVHVVKSAEVTMLPVDGRAAAERERYVTERAEVLTRAFTATLRRQPDPERPRTRDEIVAAFRDLIDKGLLK